MYLYLYVYSTIAMSDGTAINVYYGSTVAGDLHGGLRAREYLFRAPATAVCVFILCRRHALLLPAGLWGLLTAAVTGAEAEELRAAPRL